MRKSLLFVIFLFVLSLFFLQAAYSWVNQGKDAVTIEETVLLGDKAAAAGIAVSGRSTYRRHLFWDTRYLVGDQLDVETDFTFNQAEQQERWQGTPYFHVYSNINFGISGNLIDLEAGEQYGTTILKPLLDVAGRTPNGETREEILSFRDYYEFYPLVLDMMLPNSQIEINEEIQQAFAAYFKIPVPEKHLIQVTITKDQSGNIIQVESRTHSGETMFFSAAQITDSGGYFIVSLTDGDSGKPLPLPAELAGIHFLPFEQHPGFIRPLVKEMSPAYPFSSDTIRVFNLLQSPDNDFLLLFTEEEGIPLLSIIRRETMERVQQLPLPRQEAGASLLEIKAYETFIVVIFSDNSFCLIGNKASGSYELQLTGDFQPVLELIKEMRYYDLVMNYDGNRLAMAFYQQRAVVLSTCLLVYTRDGLAYAGKYDHSGDRIVNDSNGGGYFDIVRPVDQNPLRITFQ